MAFFKRIMLKTREWNYYLQEDNKPVSILSWISDIVVAGILIFTISYLWFVYKTKAPLLSIFLALSIAVLISIVFYNSKKKYLNKKRQEKWHKITREHAVNNLFKLSPEQFKYHLINLFQMTGKFSHVKEHNGFLKAMYQNSQILIGFHHMLYNEPIPTHKLYEFMGIMQSWGYSTGFFFTNSSFSNACHNMIENNPHIMVHLIDIDELLNIMEQVGMLKDEKIVHEHIKQEIEKVKPTWKEAKKNILTITTTRIYIVYGVLFLLISFVSRTFFIYYLIIAIFFFVLGLLVYLIIPQQNESKKTKDGTIN
jgi:membrane protein implicated in regulation of membrane protease activity